MSPKDEISNLINRAMNYRTQVNQAFTTGIQSDEASLIGELFVKEIIPHGYKKMSRKVGAISKQRDREQINNQWYGIREGFISECEAILNQMSINTKNLSTKGNSHCLVQKLGRASKVKNHVLFFDKIIDALQDIKRLDLIWNDDIRKELVNRIKTIDSFDKDLILDKLEPYPQVQKSITGAMKQLQSEIPDAERHCITSCRVALESLCIELGNNKDWKKALNNIFPSKTDRKQVRNVWNFLSGKGVHGGHNPTKMEAEYCFQQTQSTMDFILDRINI